MVEISLRKEHDPDAVWLEVGPQLGLHNINFERAMIRIDGIIYDELTPEVEELFDKAMIMQKLKG